MVTLALISRKFVTSSKMIDWQATEILAGCLFTALFLALALIVGQCLLSCFENWRTTRRKTDAEHLPDDYVEEIRRLLERHRKVMNEYDFPEADAEDGDIIAQAVHPVTESELDSPARVRSRSNSAKLQRLKVIIVEIFVGRNCPVPVRKSFRKSSANSK
ncbi:unnamed protein product [Nippostrongylus brasiliensis]|uniref:Uncharacterized protein n=1 Tax=Nippostrongylus brasiliensis TaxID=27835 RepID=A0A0N4Y8Y2_NIPBR|nr:unnamed protein product [Nippostrongylus brasiliensis]